LFTFSNETADFLSCDIPNRTKHRDNANSNVFFMMLKN
jgi:hypothetical protein